MFYGARSSVEVCALRQAGRGSRDESAQLGSVPFAWVENFTHRPVRRLPLLQVEIQHSDHPQSIEGWLPTQDDEGREEGSSTTTAPHRQ